MFSARIDMGIEEIASRPFSISLLVSVTRHRQVILVKLLGVAFEFFSVHRFSLAYLHDVPAGKPELSSGCTEPISSSAPFDLDDRNRTLISFLCSTLLYKSGLGENSRAQIGVLLGSLVQTITEYSENSFVKNYSNEETIREMPKGLFEKLPLLLGLMMTLARSILSSECLKDECNIKEKIWSTVQKHCINCLHKTLVDSNMQVQMAGLHALKIIVQLAIAESPKNENYKLALIFMGELVTDVFSLIWNSTQKPVSNESVAVVGKCLKLFVLLRSMIQANEPQQDVLDLLLQAIIMSASVDTEDNSQAGSGLRSIAMKLVSHIANVPSFAAQFRVVLLGMPVDLRQKLQDVIRASVAQDSNSSLATSLSVPLPAPNFVVRSLAANVEFSSQADSFIPTPLENCDDNLETEEDDDWDNFQSFPASNLAIYEETNGCETDKEDGSKQGNDFYVEKWDDFQSFSGSKLMTGSIEQEGNVKKYTFDHPIFN